LALALACALVLVAWGAGSVVALVVAHRAAQNAADLAALAGAQAVDRSQDGCTVASEIAAANKARLVGCKIEGAIVAVEVSVEATFGRSVDLRARARAGPG